MDHVYLVVSTNYDEWSLVGVCTDPNNAIEMARSKSALDYANNIESYREDIEEYGERHALWLAHASSNFFSVVQMRTNVEWMKSGYDEPEFRWGHATDSEEYEELRKKYDLR